MSKYDLPTIARDVRRALMVTAFLEMEVGSGFKHERVSDQMRRVLALLNELTFDAGRLGIWVRNRLALARALSMDKSDCALALRRLESFQVVTIEERDDGWLWIELRAARLAAAGRALEGRAAMEDIEQAHEMRVHRPEIPGIERSICQARGFGFDAAMGEVAAETDLAISNAVAAGFRRRGATETVEGRFPTDDRNPEGKLPSTGGETPLSRRGNSPLKTDLEGKLPSRPVDNRVPACAPGDSPDRQIGDSFDSSESGAVAQGKGAACGRQFRDGEKNWIFSEVQELDVKGELRDETCRRTWVARIRDFPLQIREAVGEVKEEKLLGKKITSPLGRVFVKAQSMARDLGRVMRCFLAL
jgi:hypothetical protein